MKKVFSASLSVLLIALISSCVKTEKADLVVHNAVIFSLNETLEQHQAMAISDGRIIAMGPEREILNKYRADRSLDAKMNVVYPGFNDAHSHFTGYAIYLGKINLNNLNSLEATLARLATAEKPAPGEWITGRGWDQTRWQPQVYPQKEQLDSLFPENPVLLMRVDGHAGWANSLALQLAGISGTTTVEGGKILKNDNGQPNGILIDNAVTLVSEVIPEISPSRLTELLQQAQQNCFAQGLTTVSDAGIDRDMILLLDSLQKADILKMRVYAMINPTPETEVFLEEGPLLTDRLTARAFKLYADGALGSRGACLKEPYADDSTTSGFLLNTPEFYRQFAAKCNQAGFQVNTHCIGDSANALILKIYGDILQEVNDKRWRIEHAQVVSPEDLHYFRDYSIIPSVQPTHALSDRDWAAERLGPDRIQHAYAYKDLLDQLGLLALGTDFPVEDISPVRTFFAAVFRKELYEKPPREAWYPEQAISAEQALRGMTVTPALAAFEEADKGTLEVGKYADFVVLNVDLLKASEADFDNLKILATYINGEQVYRNGGF